MRRYFLLLITVISSAIAFGQNSDPYKQFGHTSKVKYQSTVSELLYIKNPDTTAIAKAIAFDIENGYVFFLGVKDTIIEKLKVEPEKILRFISSDPLASKEPGWSPYRAFYNNPLRYTDPTGLLEFDNYKGYKKYAKENNLEVLSRKQIGSQGHWLASDRKDNTDVWGAANQYNLGQQTGYNQYTNIVQRAAFYDWFQGATEAKGFETRWAGAASKVAYAINEIANPSVAGINSTWLADKLGYSSPEARDFAKVGNRMIFEDVFPKLQTLYSGSPLKGDAAFSWDKLALSQEQSLIQPLYQSTPAFGLLSASSKQLLAGSSVLAYMKRIDIAPFPKNGNLMDVNQRWQYGMQGMNQVVLPSQMPDPGAAYTNGTMYNLLYKGGAW